jgi:hypothetical protein
MKHLDVVIKDIHNISIHDGPNGYVATILFKDGRFAGVTAYTLEALDEAIIDKVEEVLYGG